MFAVYKQCNRSRRRWRTFKDHGELRWWKDLVLEGTNPGPVPASKVLGMRQDLPKL